MPSLRASRSACRALTAGSSCGPSGSLPGKAPWCLLSWRTHTEQQGATCEQFTNQDVALRLQMNDVMTELKVNNDAAVDCTGSWNQTRLQAGLPVHLPSRGGGRSEPAAGPQPAQTQEWSTGGRQSPAAVQTLDRCIPGSADRKRRFRKPQTPWQGVMSAAACYLWAVRLHVDGRFVSLQLQSGPSSNQHAARVTVVLKHNRNYDWKGRQLHKDDHSVSTGSKAQLPHNESGTQDEKQYGFTLMQMQFNLQIQTPSHFSTVGGGCLLSPI